MPDGVTNFEVISVVRRRRRWSPEQKLALVQEMESGGSALCAVAERHGVSRSLLFEWRRQLREGTMRGVARAKAVTPVGASAPGFAPVRIADASSSLPPAQRATFSTVTSGRPRTAVPILELVLRNGRVLRVAETIAPEILGRLATALEA
jgi:transposase